MLRPRIIPSLLVHDDGLVKTTGFKDPKYVGDPLNAVRIFNEKQCDELAVFDIDATVNGAGPDFKLIGELASECRMPLCYGGGVRNVEDAKRIISLGVEKVALSAAALADPTIVTAIAKELGRQSVVVVLDVRKRMLARDHDVYTHNATRKTGISLSDALQKMQAAGAGEIIINSIDDDGSMKGYDLDLARKARAQLSIPMTMLGGAGKPDDFSSLFAACGTLGAAAGSYFVFKGVYRAVLISYPDQQQKDAIIEAGQRAGV
ncbi:AglZ/HisF2 family acetamidino modification protein [uncultured Hoeflea sp.]|uniref:AglZ/HisF2 family acetamidino modification protein n=1 Tax=uncultured Hoeflea sp. TaxID=538666 RepID=UPI00261B8DB1|nr:AglZ/HisF2 family acetamidino modification protein [uncultured Hoeflea sp.]